MFGIKKPIDTPPPLSDVFTPTAQPENARETNVRPCWVHNRKAVFHRWCDTARPVKPRGMEEDENAEYFQLYNVHGLVEFQDGTVARVWPQDIQFIDIRPEFQENVWPETETLPFTFEEVTENQEAGHGDNQS